MDIIRAVYAIIESDPVKCFIVLFLFVAAYLMYDIWQKARRIK